MTEHVPQSQELTRMDFDFEVPEALVAQTPLAERDASRLLVRAPNGGVRHRHVGDLTSEIAAGTLLILNDSRVFPSRIRGRLATGGAVEIFLLGGADAPELGTAQSVFRALARPMKKLSPGTVVHLGSTAAGELTAVIDSRDEDPNSPSVGVRFSISDRHMLAWLDENGIVPLPPYIKRPDALPAKDSADRNRYQTVYAQEAGSVAAPTAGLHFTGELLGALKARGVDVATVCLHVGAGTFLPVKAKTPAKHHMHRERFFVSRVTAEKIALAKRERRPIVTVGTTSFRSLEQLARDASESSAEAEFLDAFCQLAGVWRETKLFIYPATRGDRYRPRIATCLMTNFHQPQSTLFMLIAALIGFDAAHSLYQDAIKAGYRLFSYGDSSLLWL